MNDDMTPNRPYLIRAMHEWICDNGQIVLNIAPRAVTNFEASNQEITFSARFGGVPRTVRVPVEAVMAVFARENGQGMAFEPEDPPPQPSPTDPSDDDKPSKGSHLKVVK